MTRFKYQNKIVGELDGGTFYKVVDKSKHYMRKLSAWGLDLETFENLPPDTLIQLYDKFNDATYETNWKTYAEHGIVEDYGHGRQIFLQSDKFSKI